MSLNEASLDLTKGTDVPSGLANPTESTQYGDREISNAVREPDDKLKQVNRAAGEYGSDYGSTGSDDVIESSKLAAPDDDGSLASDQARSGTSAAYDAISGGIKQAYGTAIGDQGLREAGERQSGGSF